MPYTNTNALADALRNLLPYCQQELDDRLYTNTCKPTEPLRTHVVTAEIVLDSYELFQSIDPLQRAVLIAPYDADPDDMPPVRGTNSGGPGAPTRADCALLPSMSMGVWDPEDDRSGTHVPVLGLTIILVVCVLVLMGLYMTLAPQCFDGHPSALLCID